ncbi:hypothetical protein HMPREF0322_01634 [Desulfitobacterium hafniense DP7]|uniref:Uncharacterized protein n=1 Tax=Desulfitobacterium hafniense DP7 TaxID=537010 RepID=G9XKR3_DESHA|nr:hypothetical protein HMPREF0322_01634 [Desulfitobacterium hafniense DP7]
MLGKAWKKNKNQLFKAVGFGEYRIGCFFIFAQYFLSKLQTL